MDVFAITFCKTSWYNSYIVKIPIYLTQVYNRYNTDKCKNNDEFIVLCTKVLCTNIYLVISFTRHFATISPAHFKIFMEYA